MEQGGALFIPNRSLDRYSTIRNWKDNFLSSFIFLLASCFSFVLAVARYTFELTVNNLLNNLMKSGSGSNNRFGSKAISYLPYVQSCRDTTQQQTSQESQSVEALFRHCQNAE